MACVFLRLSLLHCDIGVPLPGGIVITRVCWLVGWVDRWFVMLVVRKRESNFHETWHLCPKRHCQGQVKFKVICIVHNPLTTVMTECKQIHVQNMSGYLGRVIVLAAFGSESNQSMPQPLCVICVCNCNSLVNRIEQGLTSPPTQYRLSGRQFYESKTQPTASKYWRKIVGWTQTPNPPGPSHRVISSVFLVSCFKFSFCFSLVLVLV